MKLARFTDGGPPELGVVARDSVISLTRAVPHWKDDMAGLISRWATVEREVRAIAESGKDGPKHEAIRFLAPIARPGKILGIGLNYADHIAESKLERPEHQVWFAKMPTAVNGPYDPIEVSGANSTADYEAELVAVVGRGGRRIDRGSAADAVFGYCVGNDVSDRRLQHTTPQWTLGKSSDTYAPFGPWITTVDEIADPHQLDIRCFVNEELRQNSNTRHLVFNVWDQIAYLSQSMTLEPGDLIFTGTPGGIGAAMSPRQFLKAGDRVRVEIECLGTIEAACVTEGG